MLGPTSIRIGPRFGPGIGGVPADGIPGVTRDPTALTYFPASTAEWSIILGIAGIATGAPSAIHLMQDASGNPACANGLFPLTASGTGLLYQQAIAGYTRVALGTTNGSTGKFESTSASLPDISTDSMLSITVALPSVIASTRDVYGFGAAATKANSQLVATTGVARLQSVGNTGNGVINSGGVVRPWVLKQDRSVNACTLYTDAEKVTVTFGATSAGKSLTFGNFIAGCGTCRYLYSATFMSAAAVITEAKIRTLLQTLGWTVSW
jgi:hypothetical protein